MNTLAAPSFACASPSDMSPLGLVCPACGGSLDIHQPRTEDPDHMLGTCLACPCWSMVVVYPMGIEVRRLPGADAVLLRRTG